jgi:23S rRNA pseudouridine1911/1915/1917 synthase
VEPGRTIEIGAEDAGARLDVVLARALGVSRGWVRKLLDSDRVKLGGRPAAKGTILRAGDRIEVEPYAPPEAPPAPNPDMELRVLAERAGWLAVDKPACVAVHPLGPDETDTMLNAVIARRPGIAGVGEGGLRSGVVHRLDPGTSGVLLFATEDDAWHAARRAFAERRVEKRYVARVHGRLERSCEVRILLESRGDHVRIVESGGREAHSEIRPLEPGDETSLVEIRIRTGVRHQIRATFAYLGHPVVGDSRYGSPVVRPRHSLHATLLAIDDFRAESPLPADF